MKMFITMTTTGDLVLAGPIGAPDQAVLAVSLA